MSKKREGKKMKEFDAYLAKLEKSQRPRMEEVLQWVHKEFPELSPRIAWNQPMFTAHGTFIIGFSSSKKHMSISPEVAGITHFSQKIEEAGYDHTKNILRIPWQSEINYDLLREMIQFNQLEKADYTDFWRK